MTWFYKDKVYNDTPERTDYVGFVYLITELETNRKYVGKKLFHSPRKRMVTLKNGNKRRKTVYVDSNWRDYFGSSDSLNEQVKSKGVTEYKREILHLCQSKGIMSYLELKEQVDREVLFTTEYYNEFIGAKIHSKHVAKYKC